MLMIELIRDKVSQIVKVELNFRTNINEKSFNIITFDKDTSTEESNERS